MTQFVMLNLFQHLMWKPTPPQHREFKKDLYKKIAETSTFIYQVGDSPILRQPSAPVPIEVITSVDFAKKLTYLKRCLRRFRTITGMGVGIAAVQVGIPEQFAIIFAPSMQKKMLIIINPVITKESKEQTSWPEICMSSHPCIAPVVRPVWIEFDYYDIRGRKQQWRTKADTVAGKRLNRIVQHEIDHINGIINIDRVAGKDIIFESDPNFYTTASFTDL